MINLEKINKVIDELDLVSKEMKNTANISVSMEKSIKTMEDAIEKSNNVLSEMGKYDKNTQGLVEQTKALTEKLQDIRYDYHKVSSAVELVEGDYKNIQKSLENITLDIKNTATSILNIANNVNDKVNTKLDKTTKELKEEMSELKSGIQSLRKMILGLGIGFFVAVVVIMILLFI